MAGQATVRARLSGVSARKGAIGGSGVGARASSGSGPSVWFALGAASAIALGLRMAFAGDQSLGYEEVFTAGIVAHPTLAGVWHGIEATESTPPLYYLLTWLALKLLGGHGAVALRATSVAAGTLAVPASFAAARCFACSRVALAVAWLCAVSPLLLEYSIYARSYALLLLVSCLSVWALGALLAGPSAARWGLWALAGIACLWTHYFTLFLLVGEVAVLAVRLPEQRGRLLAAGAVFVAGAAPLLPLFKVQSGERERTAFLVARPLGGRIADIARQFSMGTNVPAAWLEGAGIALAGGAVLLALYRTRGERSTQTLFALALAGAGIPIATALSGIDDHLLARNVIGVWVCAAPLCAYGLMRLRCVPLALYSLLCLATIIAVQSNWRYQGSPDWSGASARVRASASGEPVAVLPASEVAVAALYMHRSPLGSPVRASDLWVMIEPVRGPHQRALGPVLDPPLSALWGGGGLRPVGEIDYRGFRLIHLHAARPVVLAPAPADVRGAPGARLLAP